MNNKIAFFSSDNKLKFIFFLVISLYILSEVYIWFLLEADNYAGDFFVGGFRDSMSWAHSARIKFLHGVWFREYMDDWRPIFIVPIHQVLTWIGYNLFGLTLTGHNFFSFLSVALVKVLILSVVYKEFGWGYLLVASIGLCCYAPLNELSRTGSLDAVQMGLYLLSGLMLYFFSGKNEKKYLFITGLCIALATAYKISGLLFLFLPLVYFLLKDGVKTVWVDLRNRKSDIFYCYAGVFVFSFFYFLWLIPNLDEFVYFSVRMFGLSGNIVSIFDVSLILDRFLSLTSSKSFDEGLVAFHSYWLFGYFIYLMSFSFLPRGKVRVIDTLLVSVFIVFVFQIVFFDMAFRRYMGLMPFSIIAIARTISIVMDNSSLERTGWKNYVIFSLSFYYLLSLILLYFFDIKAGGVVLTVVLFVSVLFFYRTLILLIYRKLIILLPLLFISLYFLPANIHYANQMYTKKTYEIKESSIDLGKKIGKARVIEAQEYGLYNKTESGYMGSHSGQYKPDGWVYDENKKQTLREFSEQEYKNNFWALKLKFFDWLYPDYIDKWYLPTNYKELYHSNVFASYEPQRRNGNSYDLYLYTHYAKRHLIIGMDEPLVYVPDGVKFTDFSGQKLELNYDANKVVKIKRPAVLTNRYQYGNQGDYKVEYMTLKLRAE